MISRFLRNILGVVSRLAHRLLPPEAIPERLPALPQASYATDEWGETWMGVMDDCIFHRRFFISGRGIMGLCPNNYQEGDIVVILLGCAVPVLLRPHEGRYELVGDIYLYGYMYGKGIDELEEGKFKLEDFELC